LEANRHAVVVAREDRRQGSRLHFKNGTQRTFTGKALLLTLSIPQFFFHVTTSDILRHAGVDIAKKDFPGPPK